MKHSRLFKGLAALAMLFGVGAGVILSSHKDAVETKAEDEVFYTLAPATGTNNSYAGACDVTIDGIVWNVGGNAQMLPWRIGGKSISDTTRNVYSKTAMGSAITKVELDIGTASSITINSIALKVGTSSSSFTTDTVTKNSPSASSTLTFVPTSGSSWATGLFYEFAFNLTVSGNSNKFVEFSEARFYRAKSASATYSVTYNANGATSGSVPVDSHSYSASDSTVTVLGNTGSLAKTGHTFAGWNTNSTGTGTHYGAGSTFTISANTTLYAEWSINQYTLTYNANGGTGTLPEGGTYDYGDKVDVDSGSGLSNGDLIFSGWNTESNGSGTDYAEGSKITIEGDVTLYAKWSAAAETLTRVEDASELNVGDEIAIVSDGTGSQKALSTTQNSNNRGVVGVTVSSEHTFEVIEGVQMITLGKSNDHWTFDVGDGYLYAASSSSNYLRTQSTLNANGEWAISIANGVAAIAAQGTNSRNLLRYNNGSSCFSCYASGQGDVAIYKVAEEEKDITATNMTIGTVFASTGDTEWTLSGFAFEVTYSGDSTPTDVTSRTEFVVTESVPSISASGTMSVHVTPVFGGVTYTDETAQVTAILTAVQESALVPGTNGYSDSAESTPVSWEDGVQTGAVYLSTVSYTPAGGGNAGKYYTNGQNWRFYQSGGDNLTISARLGFVITKITFTFTVSSYGTLVDPNDGSSAIATGSEWVPTSPDRAFVFHVGNSNGDANGQIRFSRIEVAYSETSDPAIEINPVGALSSNDTGTFTANYVHATNPVVTWSSGDSSVLEVVSATGAFTAKKPGSAVITVNLTCTEGTVSVSLPVGVSGTVTISEALSLCAALPSGATSIYEVTLTGFITNLNADDREAGSERALTLSDARVGALESNDIMVFGVRANDPIRSYAILNGRPTYTGHLQNYNGTYELKDLTLVSYTDDAIEYAHNAFEGLDETCLTYGPEGISEQTWQDLADAFDALDTYAQARLKAATSSDEHSTDIANWIRRYTAIVEYGLDDFMEKGISQGLKHPSMNRGEKTNVAVIVMASVAALAAGGMVFYKVKRKKEI